MKGGLGVQTCKPKEDLPGALQMFEPAIGSTYAILRWSAC
jgi:hypothetical protein